MKIPTSELTGAALNWAVCRAQHPDADMSATHVWLDSSDGECDFLIDKTSTDWVLGGPIIDREKISVGQRFVFTKFLPKNSPIVSRRVQPEVGWTAQYFQAPHSAFEVHRQYGPTLLIAAMRCYVASKLGNKVEIPEELK